MIDEVDDIIVLFFENFVIILLDIIIDNDEIDDSVVVWGDN